MNNANVQGFPHVKDEIGTTFASQIPVTISSTGTTFEKTACKLTKKLHVCLYKITQVQVIEEGRREECIFVTGFCKRYLMVFLT
jgi:hypothetical protein